MYLGYKNIIDNHQQWKLGNHSWRPFVDSIYEDVEDDDVRNQLFNLKTSEQNPASLIKAGDHVVVTNPSLQSYMQTGKVFSCCGHTAFVEFDNWNGKGYKELTINVGNLEVVSNKGDNKMTVTGNYCVALVNFLRGKNPLKDYAYALFDNGIKVGDHVLCDVAECTNEYGVAKVVKIIPKTEYSGYPVTKEIVCQVDFSAFEKRKLDRERKAKLKAEMDRLISEDRDLVLYSALAEHNPKMAELLNNYKELDANV